MTIDETKIQEAIDWTPHKGQKEVLACDNRDIVIDAGRRWGKSAVCGYIALQELLKDNRRIWIVAPTYDLADKVFSYVSRWFLMVVPSQSGWVTRRVPAKIETPWGSSLHCKSTDSPEGLLGEEVDLLIVDEAAKIPRKVYENYLFPVTSSRKGRSIFISTPWGKNWFYEKFMSEKENGGAFHFTSKDNPYLPEGEWERAQKMLPELAFKQNYLASFEEGAGSVFRGISDNVRDTLKKAQPGCRYLIGVDLARYRDWTVLTVVDTFSHEVVFWDRFKDISWSLQKARIIACSLKYNKARVIIDSTGVGDPIAEDLAEEGLMIEDVKISKSSKEKLITKLATFLEQGYIKYPNESVLIDELNTYSYDYTDFGNITYSAPAGLHDDAVISLALAVWGLGTRPLSRKATVKRTKPKVAYEYV